MMQLPLSKRNKADILEEYQKLQEKYEELALGSTLVHSTESNTLFSKVEAYSTDHVTSSITGLKTSINTTLNELLEKMIVEAGKFKELREAIDLSKQQLEVQHHITVAAETLEILMREYEAKKIALEGDHKARKSEFEEEIVSKKRDWKREQEEYDYRIRIARERDKESFDLERQKKEQTLEERANAITAEETEIVELRRQADGFPKRLEDAQAEREKVVRVQLVADRQTEMAQKKQEWDAEKNIYELRLSTLQNEMKRQAAEIVTLRQEAERAGKKAQELAIKIVESQTRNITSQKTHESMTEENLKTVLS